MSSTSERRRWRGRRIALLGGLGEDRLRFARIELTLRLRLQDRVRFRINYSGARAESSICR